MSGYGQDAVDYLQDTQGQRQDRRQAVAGDLHDAAEKGMAMHQAAKGARQEAAQEYDSSGGRRRRSHKSKKSRKSRKSRKSKSHKGGRKSQSRQKSAGKKCPKHCRRRSTRKHRRSRKHH